ncbi:MAG: hypothetical protein Q7J06_12835 [Bacteroidales bacterium]|nr:hypothetical protein [Bacteroidales bacterium]
MVNKKFLGSIIITAFCFISAAFLISNLYSKKVTVREILDNPDRYAARMVIVEGKLMEPNFSQKHRPYIILQITDKNNDFLTVGYLLNEKREKQELFTGSKNRIRGIFQKEKDINGEKIVNFIEAESMRSWLGVGRGCISLLAISFAFLSACFLIKAKVLQTPWKIVGLVRMVYGWNNEVAKSLIAERADTIVGGACLFISVIFQSWSISLPTRFVDFGKIRGESWLIAIIIFTIVLLIGWLFSRKFQKKWYKEIEKIMGSLSKKEPPEIEENESDHFIVSENSETINEVYTNCFYLLKSTEANRKNLDTKAYWLISIVGVIITLILSKTMDLFSVSNPQNYLKFIKPLPTINGILSISILLFYVITIVLFFYAFWKAMTCLNPVSLFRDVNPYDVLRKEILEENSSDNYKKYLAEHFYEIYKNNECVNTCKSNAIIIAYRLFCGALVFFALLIFSIFLSQI